MGYVICQTQGEADTLRAKIDSALGWPKVGRGICQAIPMGGGSHVDHPLCCTQTHIKSIKHPTLTQWAVLIDNISRPSAGTIVEVTLTPDWFSLP